MEKIPPDISGYHFAVPIRATHFRKVLIKCRKVMKSDVRMQQFMAPTGIHFTQVSWEDIVMKTKFLQ